jgi:hypothetical protein
MPPPPIPNTRAAPALKGKGKAKAQPKPDDAMDEDVIELIDSDDDEPRKRPLGQLFRLRS